MFNYWDLYLMNKKVFLIALSINLWLCATVTGDVFLESPLLQVCCGRRSFFALLSLPDPVFRGVNWQEGRSKELSLPRFVAVNTCLCDSSVNSFPWVFWFYSNFVWITVTYIRTLVSVMKYLLPLSLSIGSSFFVKNCQFW